MAARVLAVHAAPAAVQSLTVPVARDRVRREHAARGLAAARARAGGLRGLACVHPRLTPASVVDKGVWPAEARV